MSKNTTAAKQNASSATVTTIGIDLAESTFVSYLLIC